MTATHSVIVPTLNCAPFIAEALNSALAQLGPEDEVIVADNGSTDDTIDRHRRLSRPPWPAGILDLTRIHQLSRRFSGSPFRKRQKRRAAAVDYIL